MHLSISNVGKRLNFSLLLLRRYAGFLSPKIPANHSLFPTSQVMHDNSKFEAGNFYTGLFWLSLYSTLWATLPTLGKLSSRAWQPLTKQTTTSLFDITDWTFASIYTLFPKPGDIQAQRASWASYHPWCGDLSLCAERAQMSRGWSCPTQAACTLQLISSCSIPSIHTLVDSFPLAPVIQTSHMRPALSC